MMSNEQTSARLDALSTRRAGKAKESAEMTELRESLREQLYRGTTNSVLIDQMLNDLIDGINADIATSAGFSSEARRDNATDGEHQPTSSPGQFISTEKQQNLKVVLPLAKGLTSLRGKNPSLLHPAYRTGSQHSNLARQPSAADRPNLRPTVASSIYSQNENGIYIRARQEPTKDTAQSTTFSIQEKMPPRVNHIPISPMTSRPWRSIASRQATHLLGRNPPPVQPAPPSLPTQRARHIDLRLHPAYQACRRNAEAEAGQGNSRSPFELETAMSSEIHEYLRRPLLPVLLDRERLRRVQRWQVQLQQNDHGQDLSREASVGSGNSVTSRPFSKFMTRLQRDGRPPRL